MARNDELDALIGLGLLGAMMNNNSREKTDMDAVRRHFNEKCDRKITPAEGAKAAKELYDSYAVSYTHLTLPTIA